MVLGGTSKSNKSWSLLDMGLSVATGQPWWGQRTTKGKVLYANFELHPWAAHFRLNAIAAARPELKGWGRNFAIWNLRSRARNLTQLRPELERMLDREEFAMIMMDPMYKLLGDRDENANSDIADLMNELEMLACRTDAAVVMAHHFAKGNSSAKEAIDRISGAGVWGRDPDSIVVLTPHEEAHCFTRTSILRNHPPQPERVLRWDYPLLVVDGELDPAALRTPQTSAKAMTDAEFIAEFVTEEARARKAIYQASGMSLRTVDRYLKRIVESGLVLSKGGLYWRATPAGNDESDN
jgi:hypothetical protein